MTPRPVAQYLAPFDAPARPELVDDGRVAREDQLVPAASAQEDLAMMARSACADAYAEGLAAGGRALEQALGAERHAFAERLASERASWAEEEGARLAEALRAALASIETSIAASVARILRPFIGAALRDKAVDELADAIRLMLRGGDQAVFEVSGAPDLIAALRGRLAGATAAIAFTPNSSADVRIVTDQTIIESRIEAWVRRIEARAEAS
jgi:hypothetical protein